MSEMEVLIDQSARTAQSTTALAVDGVAGLARLEAAVVEAETLVQAAVARTLEEIASGMRHLEETEAHFRTLRAEFEKDWSELEARVGGTEAGLEERVALWVAASEDLARRADEVANALEKGVQRCQEAVNATQAAAAAELAKVQAEVGTLERALAELRQEGEDVHTVLKARMDDLEERHERLARAISTGLGQIRAAYDESVAQLDRQLVTLETGLDALVKGGDGGLDQHLVQGLAVWLRSQADGLWQAISAMEKQSGEYVGSVESAHAAFRSNTDGSIVPAYDGLRNNLKRVGQETGFF